MLQLIKSTLGSGRYMILPSRAIQFLLLLFVVGVAGSPVMGQYNVVYSDTWVAGLNERSIDEDGAAIIDDSIPHVIVCGYGAVEVYGYSNTSLNVTLTSPNGRTASGSGDVALDLLEDGDYYSTAIATGYCGGCNCYHPFGGAGSSVKVKITYEAYLLSSAGVYSCTYALDCPEGHTCGWATIKLLKTPSLPCLGPYAQSASLLINGTYCFNNMTVNFIPTPGFCT